MQSILEWVVVFLATVGMGISLTWVFRSSWTFLVKFVCLAIVGSYWWVMLSRPWTDASQSYHGLIEAAFASVAIVWLTNMAVRRWNNRWARAIVVLVAAGLAGWLIIPSIERLNDLVVRDRASQAASRDVDRPVPEVRSEPTPTDQRVDCARLSPEGRVAARCR